MWHEKENGIFIQISSKVTIFPAVWQEDEGLRFSSKSVEFTAHKTLPIKVNESI